VTDGGWRVVGWYQRGHGDSAHTVLYSWDADLRDALAVLDSVGSQPLPVLGHSKGGGLMLQLAEARPHQVSHLVNLDGLPSKRSSPDVSERDRTRLLAGDLQAWLDHRRRVVEAVRKPGTIDELARRRHRMNLACRSTGSATSFPSGLGRTRTAGDGRSTPRFGSAGSDPGGPSGRCGGSRRCRCP